MAFLKNVGGRPKAHGSRAFRDTILRGGSAALGSDSELGKLAFAYKRAWKAELDFPKWSLAQDSDLEDACVGHLRRTRALHFALQADLGSPPTLATIELDAGANQERNALDRIREAKEAYKQEQVKAHLQSMQEEVPARGDEPPDSPAVGLGDERTGLQPPEDRESGSGDESEALNEEGENDDNQDEEDEYPEDPPLPSRYGMFGGRPR